MTWALKNDFEQLRTDENVFQKIAKDGSVIQIAIYVDDVCLFTDTDAAAEEFDQLWQASFDSSPGSGGLAQVLLGIQISRNSNEKTVTLSQPAMIEALARKFEQTEGKSFETPMAPDFDGTPIESEPTIDQKINHIAR